MDSFGFEEINLEALLLSSSKRTLVDALPADGLPVNFDHRSDGYPGYCIIA
ncbi:hypothetical protein IEO21_09448 [Rhodonia placenta]|uniref:Uncharacterized protein n=1 Tax=Rhodonia placenta TaxID=104341 RepID=A0A8H7TXV8_9APHY|nr:hypothetical protein IEO21_09448 [Postia placenta]